VDLQQILLAIKEDSRRFPLISIPRGFMSTSQADLSAEQAAFEARSQVLIAMPISKAVIHTVCSWRSKPSWMLVGGDQHLRTRLESGLLSRQVGCGSYS